MVARGTSIGYSKSCIEMKVAQQHPVLCGSQTKISTESLGRLRYRRHRSRSPLWSLYLWNILIRVPRWTRNSSKRSFIEAPVNSDPLDVFETLLQENGESLIDAHLEYALRNTTWDYEFESDYEMSVADYNGGGESHRSSGTISGLSDDWHGPGDWKPHTFGSNSWALENLPSEFPVEFDGESGITWRVGIAQQDGTEHRRWIMPAGAQSWELTDFDGGMKHGW